jgi:hypothetical protein
LNGIRILPEWFQESRGRNGARNERNGILNAQIEHRRLPTLDLGIINKQTNSPSTTTTTIDDAHIPSPPRHRDLIATVMLPSLSMTPTSVHIHCLQPGQRERRGDTTSPNERTPAMSPNERVPPMSIPHDNEEDDEGKVPRRTW